MWLTGPVAPRHVGSSQTRARTRVPCIGRQILNHCTTREALVNFKYIQRVDVLLRELNSRRHHCVFCYQLTKHLAVSASCVLELSCGPYILKRRMRRIISKRRMLPGFYMVFLSVRYLNGLQKSKQ